MPIPIIIQLNDPLCIENQFEWTNKTRHTTLDEASEDKQRKIPWKCRYLCQPLCYIIIIQDKKYHIFTWVLGYAILIKFLE